LGRELVGIIAVAEPRTSVAGKDDSPTTRRTASDGVDTVQA
jgi:hypothetical protein